jgi:hypothetical protein
MGRSGTFVKMTPEEQAMVDGLLRRYQYGCLDTCVEELAAKGITFSRSALHRHARRLQSSDLRGGAAPGAGQTLVTVTDLGTNQTVTVRTTASAATVSSAVGALQSGDL